MGVWGYILLFSLGFAAFILILSAVFTLSVSFAARRFSDKTLHKSVAELEGLLPGKNCGQCGCETCAEYARAVFACQMDTDRCVLGAPDLPQRLDTCLKKFEKLLERDEKKTDI